MSKIILLGGPTASGKSALSLKWAEQQNGEIVNGDSMQIYQELNILTARPSDQELNIIPHHLYGILKGDDPCSAERWRALARRAIDDIWQRGKLPIVVGGTGLYLKSLTMGLSKVPAIDENIRKAIRANILEEGAEQAHGRLSQIDPEMATRLAANDGQRVGRALEVIKSTGKSLLHWQALPLTGGLVDEDVELDLQLIERDRADLYGRCNARFEAMIRNGDVIEEVRSLMTLDYDKNLPVMKSLGVPQIIDYIAGTSTLEQAITLSQTATRQFAKRQMTWFRNQFPHWKRQLL